MPPRKREPVLEEPDSDVTAGEEDADASVEEGPQPPKRARTGGVREFPKGSVKLLKVFNFMTYGEPAVTITPGPRLNLVLGPNGTGKSSLVCALCVGLGESTKLLGRADNVKDYIRRGADKGWVETTLSGGPGRPDYVIYCELVKSGESYTTNWKINRVSRSKKDVQELVRSLNIQFDNLCQFLPQDKVVEFARLEQHELLVATEKAIGDASLHQKHLQLNERRAAIKEQELLLAAERSKLERLTAENAAVEREYQRFRRRKNLEQQITLVRKKVVWMDVKDAQDRARDTRAAKEDAESAYRQAAAEAQQDEGPAKRRKQAAEAAKKAAGDKTAAVRAKQQEAKAAADKLQKEDDEIREIRGKLNGLAAASRKQAADIERLKKKLVATQEQLEKLPPVPDHSARQQELTEEMNAIREQLMGIENEKAALDQEMTQHHREEARLTGELRQCDNANYQRLRALMASRRGMDGLIEATKWVEQQRQAGAFQGPVVGPLGAEVRLTDSSCAGPLEQATFFSLCDFACTTQRDADMLTAEFKARALRSNVVAVVADISAPIASNSAQLRGLGVHCSLDETYDAPPLVKHCLAQQCNLDRIYVMQQHDMAAVKRLMEGAGVTRVFTPELQVNFIASAYGGREDGSLQTSGLYPSRVLGASGPSADLEQRKAQLQQQLASVQAAQQSVSARGAAAAAREAPLNQQLEELQQQKTELAQQTSNLAKQRAHLQQTVKTGQTHLAKLQAKPDPLAQAPALERHMKKALTMHHAMLTKQLDATLAQWQLLQQHAAAEMAWRELEMQALAMSRAQEERRSLLSGLQRAAEAAARAHQAAAAAYKSARDAAEADHPLDAATRNKFTEIPDTREELQAELEKLEDERANITVNNPCVVEEYRSREVQIRSTTEVVAGLTSSLESAGQQLQQLKDSWLPELKRVVSLINESFSRNFSQIGCAGEVLLAEDEDYDKFSIQVKVKFREGEELQLLTAHRQSGGERSASTILYLIALQGVTVTPFRVVDEINQGMDPLNERKIFRQLVEASCSAGTPQCFLLTPKLLPDLPFTEDITVLNIFNGPLIDEAVAGSYSRALLLGSRGVAALQRVPVAS